MESNWSFERHGIKRHHSYKYLSVFCPVTHCFCKVLHCSLCDFANKLSHYDDEVAQNIAKWDQLLQVQTMWQVFDSFDLISILSFLSALILAHDTNGILEAIFLWLSSYLCSDPLLLCSIHPWPSSDLRKWQHNRRNRRLYDALLSTFGNIRYRIRQTILGLDASMGHDMKQVSTQEHFRWRITLIDPSWYPFILSAEEDPTVHYRALHVTLLIKLDLGHAKIMHHLTTTDG